MTDSNRWLWMAGLFLLGWLLYLLHPILSPFLIGILLAYLGDPLVDRLERHRLSRTGGVVLVFTLFALVLLIMLLVLVPMLGRQLVRLYQLAPEMLDWLQGTALPWSQSHLGLQNDLLQVDQLKQVFSDNIGKTTDVLRAVLAQATSSGLALLAWLGNLLLIPVVSFYLMRDWDVLVERVRRLLPRQREALVVKLAGECHEVLGAFLRGQLLVMVDLATTLSFLTAPVLAVINYRVVISPHMPAHARPGVFMRLFSIMSIVFLKEQVHWRRWLGIILSFSGVMVISFDPAVFTYIDGLLFVVASALAAMERMVPELLAYLK